MNFKLQTLNFKITSKSQPKNQNVGIYRFGFILKLVVWILMLLFFCQPVIASYPQRIVSGMPSITEMLYALNLEDRIVGVTTNCNYPPEVEEQEKVGGFFINLEKAVSLKPDLIIMLEDAQKRDIKKLEDFGLPIYTVNPQKVIDVMGTLIELGEVTGAKERAEEMVEAMKERILSVEAKYMGLPQENVLVIIGYKPLVVVGGDNFIDDILRYVGVENVAGQSKAAYPQYSFEKLLKDNPDYIIVPEGVVERREIEEDSRWSALDAVRNGRILFINEDILSRPGPRVVDAIEQIAEFIYEKKT